MDTLHCPVVMMTSTSTSSSVMASSSGRQRAATAAAALRGKLSKPRTSRVGSRGGGAQDHLVAGTRRAHGVRAHSGSLDHEVKSSDTFSTKAKSIPQSVVSTAAGLAFAFGTLLHAPAANALDFGDMMAGMNMPSMPAMPSMSMGGEEESGSSTNLAPGEPDAPHTSAEWLTWAIGSAAPSYIRKDATIVNGNDVLKTGTNGWTCVAANPRPVPDGGWPSAHEAMGVCGDAEGMKWIQAFVGGTKPELERDIIMYMLAGDMGEDNYKPMTLSKNDAGEGAWIESGSHVMLMPKDPASVSNFPADFQQGEPYVMFKDTPYAHVMIPTGEGYFDYQK